LVIERINRLLVVLFIAFQAGGQPLPGTQPLAIEGDLASQMLEGIDQFLDKQAAKAVAGRGKFWRPNTSSAEAFNESIEPNRQRLAHILGLRDARPKHIDLELLATPEQPALVGKSDAFEVYAVRWTAFADVHAEGLLLRPVAGQAAGDVVAIPDADQTPEQIAGLAPGVAAELQYAKRLAEHGCRVLVPVLIDRHVEPRAAPGRKGGPELTNREFIFRQSYELGRHVIGYDLQKVLAGVDYFKQENRQAKVGVYGWGEGGMLALYAAALDPRVDVGAVSGYFGDHDAVWREPIDRTVWGLTGEFGAAELHAMTWPRGLIVESGPGPKVIVKGKGGAPGELVDPVFDERPRVKASTLLNFPDVGKWAVSSDPSRTLAMFVNVLTDQPARHVPAGEAPEVLRKDRDAGARQARQLEEEARFCQELIARSAETRREFMKGLDTGSVEKYEASVRPYRERLYNEVLGRFDEPLLPINARTRKVYDTEKYVGYEVVLDVFPEVIAYGVLLLPKDLKEGERRPVVVCQHGLEGRPKDTIEGNSHFYHDFAARLAERGFITFSPQNSYIFGERFRLLSRKAAPIGKTMWSWITPQHQQILAFLKSLPNVDSKRIGFYGLSYGGKTAMRVPAVLTDYCLSICSGDFNEWVYKICSNRAPWSYLYTNEYEMYEFDLGSAFNYAEMAALIAPRPFMVERGHFDGVSSDEWVAFEFAKVRRLYNGRLKLGDRCEIEFFDGPHTINGKGTFEFLHKHLNWEKR
jgi:dienelactone hydrolase